MILAERQEFDDVSVEISKGETSPDQRPRTRPLPSGRVAVALSLLALILVGISLGSVLQKTAIVAAGYKLQDYRSQLKEVKETHARLNLTISNLKSLDRIETIARTRLGMVSPTNVQFLVINEPPAPVGVTSLANVQTGWTDRLLAALGEAFRILLPGDTAEAGSINR